MKTPISEAEILAARTPKGAWTAKQLAAWGVPWPPPGGWKDPALCSKSTNLDEALQSGFP